MLLPTTHFTLHVDAGPIRLYHAHLGCGPYAPSRLGGLLSRSPRCFGERVVRRRLGPRLEFGGDLTDPLGE